MVSPTDAIEVVVRTIAESNALPDDMGVLLHEADLSGEDSDVNMPTLEVLLNNSERVHLSNTDFVGYVEDDNGNHIGHVYESEYEVSFEVNIWTSTDDGYDPDELGKRLRDALYPYTSHGPSEAFTDENGNVIDEMYYFDMPSGTREDDLIQTPTVRRWRQNFELWACEEFQTTKDYIVQVDYPEDQEFDDSDNDGVIEA